MLAIACICYLAAAVALAAILFGGCSVDGEAPPDAGRDAGAEVQPGSRVPGGAFDGGAL
jgi:hypothetical protein